MAFGVLDSISAYFEKDGSAEQLLQLINFYVKTHNHIVGVFEDGGMTKKELRTELIEFYGRESMRNNYGDIIELLVSEFENVDEFVGKLLTDIESSGDMIPEDGKYEWTGTRIIL